MQVEAQLAPSDYKMTGAQRRGVCEGAVRARTRFTVTAQGTDVYDAVIKIVDTEELDRMRDDRRLQGTRSAADAAVSVRLRAELGRDGAMEHARGDGRRATPTARGC